MCEYALEDVFSHGACVFPADMLVAEDRHANVGGQFGDEGGQGVAPGGVRLVGVTCDVVYLLE